MKSWMKQYNAGSCKSNAKPETQEVVQTTALKLQKLSAEKVYKNWPPMGCFITRHNGRPEIIGLQLAPRQNTKVGKSAGPRLFFSGDVVPRVATGALPLGACGNVELGLQMSPFFFCPAFHLQTSDSQEEINMILKSEPVATTPSDDAGGHDAHLSWYLTPSEVLQEQIKQAHASKSGELIRLVRAPLDSDHGRKSKPPSFQTHLFALANFTAPQKLKKRKAQAQLDPGAVDPEPASDKFEHMRDVGLE